MKTRGWPRLADRARSQLTLTEATLGQVSQVNRPGSVRVARETSEPRFWFLQSLLDMADAAREDPWRQSFNVLVRNRAARKLDEQCHVSS